MKKLLIIIIITAIVQLTKANILSKRCPTPAIATDTLKRDSIDPVCKMKVKAGNATTVVYDKTTYAFCSESCKKAFNKTPEKYVKKKKTV